MRSTDNPVRSAARRSRRSEHRAFWSRVTEGIELQQLWGQFLSDAKASYDLYAKDVDWEKIEQRSKGRIGLVIRSVWALFQAMLMKLTPARRVLLLIAIVLLLVQVDIHSPNHEFSLSLSTVGVLIVFLILALELADRVTMKRDLEIAREIQVWLVPDHAPDVSGMEMAFATRPQNTVAGDYYDAFLRPGAGPDDARPLLIAVADVAGKSVPAALLMASFQASLHALASTPADLSQIVAGLDRYARAHSLEGRRFTTAFLAQIDTETREMEFTNAGHNDPILMRASGEVERLSAGGPPFGLPLFTESETSYGSGKIRLRPGDLLFIFTDGVVEAENDKGEEFGESHLLPCIQDAHSESAAATLQRVIAAVNAFVGQVRQHDDITCFVLRINS